MAILTKTDEWAARNQERIRQAYARFPDLTIFEDRYWACYQNGPDDPRWLGLQMMGHDLPNYVLDYYCVQQAIKATEDPARK
jgi:hypothetical protein